MAELWSDNPPMSRSERIKEWLDGVYLWLEELFCDYWQAILMVIVMGLLIWGASLPNKPSLETVELVIMKREAINLGYAEYNRTNGNWQWITNLAERK